MSLVIAQSLSRRGVEVIGCDNVGLTVQSFSRHVEDTFVHPALEDDEDAYFECMIENIKKFRPDDDRPYLLMPVFQNTRAIAKNRDRLEPFIKIAGPSWESIEKIFPKHHLADTAAETKARVPVTLHTDDPEIAASKIREMTPPLMIKPIAGVGGRGIETFKTAEETINAHEKFLKKTGEAPLIQEKVDGEDYCFTGLFRDGELIAHMAYRNLKSFPAETGAGSIRETVEDSPFVEPAAALMKATNWTGVAEIDFLWTGNSNDKPTIIEVNPRFWAGLFHSVKSGIDFPWLLYQLFTTGEIDDPPAVRVGEITKTPGLWLASTAQEIAESDIHFDRLSEAWKSDENSGFFHKLGNVTSALSDAVDLDDACFRLVEAFDIAKHSSDEFSEVNDPFAGLGILFVLSSLARHGKLPPEIKR
ncbi:ATP-grasp domain-containing protein [Hyphococcus sp. DH-69]|uniref:carboxylate--amine ligase n=1 Tax=Hyphococcus formosus TaxID=3143534 RepID=UPI00398B09D9